MLDLKSFNEDSPVPAVDPDDLRRVWALVQSYSSTERGSVGFAASAIAERCISNNPDPIAVMFRSNMLTVLQRGGFLTDWQEGTAPRHIVFATMAKFPMPHGLAAFDVNAFLAELDKA